MLIQSHETLCRCSADVLCRSILSQCSLRGLVMSDFILPARCDFIIHTLTEIGVVVHQSMTLSFPHSQSCYSLCFKLELNPALMLALIVFFPLADKILAKPSLSECTHPFSLTHTHIPKNLYFYLIFCIFPNRDFRVFLSVFDNRSGFSHFRFNTHWAAFSSSFCVLSDLISTFFPVLNS